jgi:hypothetical protein
MRIGKLIGSIAGVMLLIAGFGLSVAGGLALAVPDDEGWVTVGPARVRSDAAALVGDNISIDLGDHVADGRTFVSWDVFSTEITVEGRSDKAVFVGVGPATAVSDYLDGTAVAYADWHDDDFDVARYVPGGAASDPAEQDFWIATSSDGVLDWDISDGEWAVVVVNEDGSPGIDVAVTGAARIPFIGAIGVGLLTAGLVFLVLGGVSTYYGVRAVPQPQEPLPPTGPAVTA